MHSDKTIFKVDELPLERFAASLGLPGTPKIKLRNRETAKNKKNAPHFTQEDAEVNEGSGLANDDQSDSESSDSEVGEDNQEPATASERDMKVNTIHIHEVS